jgi:hypothetical protein
MKKPTFPPRYVLFVLAVLGIGIAMSQAATAQTTLYEEDFDSVAVGGDGVHGFVFEAVLPFAMNNDDADGYRCQYSDPDNPDSATFGVQACFPLNANEWHVDTQAILPSHIRSFSGDGSLHLGKHLIEPLGTSYTTGQMSHATSPMITLAGGGDYELSFRHIVSFLDFRIVNTGPNSGIDRGVVQVAEVDPGTGEPVSAWSTIQATTNNYANGVSSIFFNCTFDPIDDGSSEVDLFTLPGQFPFGPSSTCDDGMGRMVYTNMGHALSVNTADVGSAADGGGALGNLGPGVWVESVFPLSPFADKTIKVRFLFSGLSITSSPFTWQDFFGTGPDEFDDGWLIDDVTVSALPPPAEEVVIDIKFCSNPNAFNCRQRGVLPVTIFGSDALDVADIDPSTLTLCLADDIGQCTNGPRDWSIHDRGDPGSDLGTDECEGEAGNPDGNDDMDVAFEATEVQALLGQFCAGPRNVASPTLAIIGETYSGVLIFSTGLGDIGIDQLTKR